ncbi:MAG: DUF4399 domain-containing protein [Gammaproteobacteria bacterium]|nr:DUF4399 domain-containing protein [Gammaproteobacteria bacterium]
MAIGKIFLCTLLLSISAAAGAADQTASAEGARAYIVSPQDGDTVSSPVTVVFGLKGMGVAPAGTDKANTGHHHLLVDTDIPAQDQPLPASAKLIHFGGGQTETTLELPAGLHTLQLVLGDMNHIPHTPPVVSEKITITVE